MTLDTRLGEIVEQDGVLAGPYRAPVNLAASAAGSIHDDATAQKLGFRGGTVAGSIHMEQFPPILMRAFGREWFETGSLSCYFRNATLHGERVRPFLRPSATPGGRASVWMERDDGLQVLEGSASLDPRAPTLLDERLANPPARGDTRILGHLQPGQRTERYPTRLDSEKVARRLQAITEPLDWYTGPSPWGGPIANPGLAISIIRAAERGLAIRSNRAVGLFGALEVKHLGGPIFLDRDYECSAVLLQVGETPRSEFLWYRATLHEGDRDVAEVVMMLRFMKASSELWAS
jgi:hypothetical protein